MSIDYATLLPRQTVSRRSYLLDADTVARYVDAVEDRSREWNKSGDDSFAPPMAVAALALRGVINDLAVPGGTLHVGQEIDFKGAVQPGETLDCEAKVVQNSVRGEWRFMTVQLAVKDGGGRQVMTGKSTIILPV